MLTYKIYSPWQNIAGVKSKKTGWEKHTSTFGDSYLGTYYHTTLSGEALILKEPAKAGLRISEGRLQRIATIQWISPLPKGKDWEKAGNEIAFSLTQFCRNKQEREEFYAYIRTMGVNGVSARE